MKSYKTINNDLDNYEAQLKKYQSKIKNAQQEKRKRVIKDIGLHFLNETHLKVKNIKNDKTLFEKYSFSKKDPKQKDLQEIGKKLLDKTNLNLHDMLSNPSSINDYSIINQKELNEYKQANHNYQIIIKTLSHMANDMYRNSQGYYRISNNDLRTLSTWFYNDFREKNYNQNQNNDKDNYNN